MNLINSQCTKDNFMPNMFLYLLMAVFLALIIIAACLSVRENRRKDRLGIIRGTSGKGELRKMSNAIYSCLERLPIVGSILRKFTRPYELIYPKNAHECEYIVISILVKDTLVFIGSSIVIGLFMPVMFTGSYSILGFVSAGIITYMVACELSSAQIKAHEFKFCSQMEDSLTYIKHEYYMTHNIREAIIKSIPKSGSIMSGHLTMLGGLIATDSGDMSRSEYLSGEYHHQLRHFFSVVLLQAENGGSDSNGDSFENALMTQKEMLHDEALYLTKRKNKFAFLPVMLIMSIAFIPYVPMWGMKIIPSLKGFYRGVKGNLAILILMCLCLTLYGVFRELRDREMRPKRTYDLIRLLSFVPPFRTLTDIMSVETKKNGKLQELIRRTGDRYSVKTFSMLKILLALFMFIAGFFCLGNGHVEMRQLLVEDISDIEEYIPAATTLQLEKIRGLIPEMMEYYTQHQDAVFDKDEVLEKVHALKLRSEEVNEQVCEEIRRRLSQYEKELFTWKDAITLIIMTFAAYCYPSLLLMVRMTIVEKRMSEETLELQTVICMLYRMPGMDSYTLLESMEMFSDIFRPFLRHCMNGYGDSRHKAFMTLKNSVDYEPFGEIVDDLLMIDDVGMEKAFEEISTDIRKYKADRDEMREEQLGKDVTFATIMAMAPAVLIGIGYLTIPFLIKCVQIFYTLK